MADLYTKELEDKSEEGRRFYTTSLWGKIRNAVLSRDGNRCSVCGKKSKGLIVHHVSERVLGGSDTEDNLITLCKSCHLKIHIASK